MMLTSILLSPRVPHIFALAATKKHLSPPKRKEFCFCGAHVKGLLSPPDLVKRFISCCLISSHQQPRFSLYMERQIMVIDGRNRTEIKRWADLLKSKLKLGQT